MSNSGYFPNVVNPGINKIQTMSGGFQKPFFFGGSQVPVALGLNDVMMDIAKSDKRKIKCTGIRKRIVPLKKI